MKHSTLTRALRHLAACFALSASAHAGVVLSGGGLALVEEGGGIASGNLSALGTSTAFAKDVLPGYASHQIPNLNDQLFGNAESWIGNTTGTFAGVSFGGTAVQVSSIAFGRDNNGGLTDRTLGTYTLQYTTQPNPTNATSAWTTIGTFNYQSAGGTNFAFPSKRHRYFFNPVTATGIRLLVPAGGLSAGTCIDELEAYSSIVVANTADSGAGSLRQAILDAATASGPTHISFAPGLSGQTITLASEIVISDAAPVAIDATSLPAGITIDGGPGFNRIFSIPAGQNVTLNRLTLTGGDGTGATNSGYGGAIFNRSSLLTLNHCSFQGNSATGYGGGGIYNESSSPTLNNCSFQGNSTSKGGGIFNDSSSPTLNNCSFQGNRVTGSGGGIYNESSSPTLNNCSFQGNSANGGFGSGGGGIFNDSSSSPTLNNCIIWKNKHNSEIGTANSSVFNASFFGAISTPTYSHCLIQGYSKAQLDAGTSPDTNLSPNNPLFVLEVDPENAPTTGGVLRLRPGSPAIDAGDNTKNPTSTDLGGKPRFIDGNMDNIATIDLGAHESRIVFVNVAVSGGNQDGTSWANAFTHLQSALAAVQSGDEIWVAQGTHYPDLGTGQTDNNRNSTFALKPGVSIYGGFPGTGAPAFTARNPVAHPTILSGDIGTAGVISDNAYQVLTASGAAITSSTILDGFTITAGNANGGTTALQLGGGIYIFNSASPSLNNCSFQDNSAFFAGGGIFNDSSSPTLTNCSFQGNSTQYGGGISNNNASPTLTNCSFQGNHATLNGGGIYNFSSTPTLNNCIIWKNKDNTGIGTAVSSIFPDVNTSTHFHCLIQGYSKAALDNGVTTRNNLEPTDPLFVREVDPVNAPTTGGDLRLRAGSPAIDAGDNTKNPTPIDLGGKPRLIDGNMDNIATIDLGAHEWRRVLVNAAVSGGNQDGTSWANAFPHLQDALAAAQAGDEIWVAKGTYYPDLGIGQTDNNRSSTFALKAAVGIYGGFAGNETSFSQRNPATNLTTLSGDIDQNDEPNFANNSNNAYKVLTASGASITASSILDGFTITAGNANGSNGGGLSCSGSASPTLNNCSFQGNYTEQQGGGIFIISSSPTFNNCSFQGNHASANGGGIYNFSSSPTLNNCSFQGNRASTGGGIYNWSSSPKLNNCIIWKNKDGSGIGTTASSVSDFQSSTPTYSHCLIQGYSKGDLDATGTSPDTNLAPTDPLFVLEVDPTLVPTTTTGGDLRLRPGSPAIDKGDNTKNPTSTDLGGKPRFIDGDMDNIATIDLGAHEWRRVFVNAAVSGGNQDGTSWANVFTHLQDALAAAQAGDEIWVAEGTYFPDQGTGQADNNRTSTFALKATVGIYGGFSGTEITFSQRNPAAHPAILSGDIGTAGVISDNAYQVLTASGAAITSSTILDGFTITAGNANGEDNPFNAGGGLYCESASPTLNHCSFQGNSALAGGGMFNSSSSPTLTNCSFQGNSASNGGGMFNSSSSPTLTNCSFLGNRAFEVGGGILNLTSSSTLTNCSFLGNSAGDGGGGIANLDSAPTLNNCSLQGNSATNVGGGIANTFSSSPKLNNCIIWKNMDSSGIGTASTSVFNAIFFGSTSIPTYSHCLIQGYSKGDLDDTGSSPDTNLAPNDPLFVREVDPNLAPTTTGGDLRLLTGSPALNVGDDTKNSTNTDLAGNPRKDGIIDLGAYEGNLWATFGLLHPTLDPSGDANGNGIPNFGDYAAGGNPSALDDPSLRPKLIGNQLTFSFRNNAEDITKVFQKSTTLLPGSWNPLVLTTDYTVSSSTSSGGRSLQTLTLDSTLLNNPKLFFRQEFRSISPQ